MAPLPGSPAFGGRLVMLGFGCIGQGTLPLLLRHVDLDPQRILILSPEPDEQALAQRQGLRFLRCALTEDNYLECLAPLLRPGDLLLNLSVEVSSLALLRLCHACGVLYLDTCIEPWAGGYDDPSLSLAERSNYALREAALTLRAELGPGPTALLTHGANPGLVSHLLKQALLNLAGKSGLRVSPACREDWARLAQRLGVRCIHIAERDTQYGARPKAIGEFANTWSVPGFISEAGQPAELGWGSHERELPADGCRHENGCRAAIYLQRPGAATRVHSWTPQGGAQLGLLITHGESISIADYFTLGDPAAPEYRPTVLYAYHPCDAALLSLHELAGRHWRPQPRQRLLRDELLAGSDALGVLLLGSEHGAYWYGSLLTLDEARRRCPANSATSLQVAAAVMAGVVWTIGNPRRGILEPDELPHHEILRLCRPYLGRVRGVHSGWTPLKGRRALFPEPLLADDPWQFANMRAL